MAVIYLLKVKNGNTRTMCEKFRHQNDDNDAVLMFLLLTLNRFHTLFQCFHHYFGQINAHS